MPRRQKKNGRKPPRKNGCEAAIRDFLSANIRSPRVSMPAHSWSIS
jgi:hypothetical protein